MEKGSRDNHYYIYLFHKNHHSPINITNALNSNLKKFNKYFKWLLMLHLVEINNCISHQLQQRQFLFLKLYIKNLFTFAKYPFLKFNIEMLLHKYSILVQGFVISVNNQNLQTSRGLINLITTTCCVTNKCVAKFLSWHCVRWRGER